MRSPISIRYLNLEIVARRERGIGSLEGEGRTGVESRAGGGKLKSTLSPHIMKDMVPVGTSITASAVARNGRSKMSGARKSSFMSRTTKSQGIRNLLT